MRSGKNSHRHTMHSTPLQPASRIEAIRSLCVGGVAGKEEEGTMYHSTCHYIIFFTITDL